MTNTKINALCGQGSTISHFPFIYHTSTSTSKSSILTHRPPNPRIKTTLPNIVCRYRTPDLSFFLLLWRRYISLGPLHIAFLLIFPPIRTTILTAMLVLILMHPHRPPSHALNYCRPSTTVLVKQEKGVRCERRLTRRNAPQACPSFASLRSRKSLFVVVSWVALTGSWGCWRTHVASSRCRGRRASTLFRCVLTAVSA